jgi:hypothetical protein
MDGIVGSFWDPPIAGAMPYNNVKSRPCHHGCRGSTVDYLAAEAIMVQSLSSEFRLFGSLHHGPTVKTSGSRKGAITFQALAQLGYLRSGSGQGANVLYCVTQSLGFARGEAAISVIEDFAAAAGRRADIIAAVATHRRGHSIDGNILGDGAITHDAGDGHDAAAFNFAEVDAQARTGRVQAVDTPVHRVDDAFARHDDA